MKKSTRKYVLLSLVIITGIIAITAGITYAYFLLTVNAPIESTINSGEIAINFETTNTINETSMLLIKEADIETDAEKLNFSISHGTDSTLEFGYFIYLTEIEISDNFKSADFKYEITIDGTSTKCSGNFGSIGTSVELQLCNKMIKLPLTATHDLTLKLWLQETAEIQNDLLEGSFKGKIKIVATR